MRCALDLQMVAKVKAEENTKAELLRRQKEDIARRARTIEFCEKLGKELEKKAESGNTPTISFDCQVNNFPRLLIATRKEYADGRISHYAVGASLDLNLISEWFAQYCFEVVCHKAWTWNYGFGKDSYYRVTISPEPECIQ